MKWNSFEARATPQGVITSMAVNGVEMPLAGHSGSCAKVMHAAMTGELDMPCSCGKEPLVDVQGNRITGP